MGKRFYRIACPLIRAVTPHLSTVWEQPWDGQESIFVCNHARAMGPVNMAVYFPVKGYIWIYANAMSARDVPAYVRQDYWWDPKSGLAPFYNATVPYLAAALLPPILRSVPYVKVYHGTRALETLRESLRLMKEGKSMIIFPGIPDGYKSHEGKRINEGFLQLLPRHCKRTGRKCRIWPVHLNMEAHRFEVGAPIDWDENADFQPQIPELCERIARGIREEE